MRFWLLVFSVLAFYGSPAQSDDWKGDEKYIVIDKGDTEGSWVTLNDDWCGGKARLVQWNGSYELQVRKTRCERALLALDRRDNIFSIREKTTYRSWYFPAAERYQGNTSVDSFKTSFVFYKLKTYRAVYTVLLRPDNSSYEKLTLLMPW